MSLIRTIESPADIAEGVAALRQLSAHLARVHELVGDPPLRRRSGGFAGLARIVSGQQLSVASAEAIWRRLEAAITPFGPDVFLAADDDVLRATGLSRGKIATLRGLATAITSGVLDLDALSTAPEALVHEQLTALKGIGPWTADIYIMFCLGRPDGWSPGDLALQYAVAEALELPARPSQAEMVEIAEAWRPWRAVAARMLWAYYAHRRGRAATPLPPIVPASQSA